MKSLGSIVWGLMLFVFVLRPAIAGNPGLGLVQQTFQGSADMLKAYNDMRQANWKGADKYFHARGNFDAAKRGPGGVLAAKFISNAREAWQGSVSGRGAQDSRADQIANRWGRNGGNPNFFRPPGLPSKY